MDNTPGPWIDGNTSDSIIAPGSSYSPDTDNDYYGGCLIAETVAPQNKPLIKAAPELLGACELGDSMGNPGPVLLNFAADLIETFAPSTAAELRRKAEAEHAAILKARGTNA